MKEQVYTPGTVKCCFGDCNILCCCTCVHIFPFRIKLTRIYFAFLFISSSYSKWLLVLLYFNKYASFEQTYSSNIQEWKKESREVKFVQSMSNFFFHFFFEESFKPFNIDWMYTYWISGRKRKGEFNSGNHKLKCISSAFEK